MPSHNLQRFPALKRAREAKKVAIRLYLCRLVGFWGESYHSLQCLANSFTIFGMNDDAPR